LQQDYYLRSEEIRPIVAAAMSKAVEQFLEDGLLTEEEEKLLRDIQGASRITLDYVDAEELVSICAKYGFSRWDYAGLLRDNFFKPKESLEMRRKVGKTMAEMTDFGPPFAFRLAADEFLGDIQDSIAYCRAGATRQYLGRGQGLSVRLGRGVYHRVGIFRGQPIEQTELLCVDMGRFAYSNRALYFWGKKERIRIPFGDILSHEAGYDSITFWRDRTNAKPDVFSADAGFGWYIANVIANVHLMDRNDPLLGAADDGSMLKLT
jgi:hypothetical protein